MNGADYIAEVERRCGQPLDHLAEVVAEDGPTISVVGFNDYPGRSLYTYFTHGLHLLNKAEWHFGRPEYYITIERSELEYASLFGFIVSAFAPKKVMGWSTLLGVSELSKWRVLPYGRIALGPPEHLDWRSYLVRDPGLPPINLGIAYLISDSDFEKASRAGFAYLEQKMAEDYTYCTKIQTV